MDKKKEIAVSGARIKVVGVGGGGSNAANNLGRRGIQGVELVAINTDAVHLMGLEHVKRCVVIGRETTRGLGCGADPEKGLAAAKESLKSITHAVSNADLVFVTAGMGGGTGTGAAPEVARIAKKLGALVIGIVTKPFGFEGRRRMAMAENGIEELRPNVDALIIIPNDRLVKFEIIPQNTPIVEAFKIVDDVLACSAEAISKVINIPGLVNVDFADIKTTVKDSGNSIIGIGEAEGTVDSDRMERAFHQAINSPLLEGLEGGRAMAVLVNITGGPDMTLFEVNTAALINTENFHPNASVIYGAVIDESLQNKVKVTIIMTKIGTEANLELIRRKHPETEIERITSDPDLALRTVTAVVTPLLHRDHEENLEKLQIPAFLRKK